MTIETGNNTSIPNDSDIVTVTPPAPEENADTSAFSEDQTRAGLLDEVKKEAVQAIDEIADYGVASDKALWHTMQATLKLAETFLSEDAVKAYYERQTKKPVHGNTTNLWQLIVKLSFPPETDSGWKTRFGQALAALIREGVKSAHVMEELAQRKALDKIATKKAATYSGINRFALLYKKQEQERKKRETAKDTDGSDDTTSGQPDADQNTDVSSETNPSMSKQNRYLEMSDVELKSEALHVFEALRQKKIVPTKFLKLEDLLRLPPSATSTH